MENILYNELRMRGYNVDVGVMSIAQKASSRKVTRKRLEVDFVCNASSNKYYIQSACSILDVGKREQEIRPFRKIDDSFKKIVVIQYIVPYHYNEHGILVMYHYDFLLETSKLNH